MGFRIPVGCCRGKIFPINVGSYVYIIIIKHIYICIYTIYIYIYIYCACIYIYLIYIYIYTLYIYIFTYYIYIYIYTNWGWNPIVVVAIFDPALPITRWWLLPLLRITLWRDDSCSESRSSARVGSVDVSRTNTF